jgi:chemotaxis protein CheX
MQFFENEIKEYAEFAWSTLDFKITPSSGQLDDNTENLITANIQVNGDWQGVVALVMEHELALQLAIKTFSLEKEQVTDEDINDSASEMMNIIGGNLKSMLPQPNQLGLPIVDLKGARLNFPFTKQLSQVTFDCMGKKFSVAIHQVANKNLQNQPSEVNI